MPQRFWLPLPSGEGRGEGPHRPWQKPLTLTLSQWRVLKKSLMLEGYKLTCCLRYTPPRPTPCPLDVREGHALWVRRSG
jgi:hypothetical protein